VKEIESSDLVMDMKFRVPLENGIKDLFKNALRISLYRFSFFIFLLGFTIKQLKAIKLRKKKQKEGIIVPPFMIVSVTSRCNLNCVGCYSKINHDPSKTEMTDSELISVLSQAEKLGTSISLLAGGEPLQRFDLLSVTRHFPNMLFPLFTNGMLIDKYLLKQIKKQPNVIPILSIEGSEDHTNKRRGNNVHQNAINVMDMLQDNKIFFGISFTVTNENISTITDYSYLDSLSRNGVKVFFYNEYVPFEPGTENLCLSKKERIVLENKLNILRSQFSALFISFPGDESQFGGCLSAGRGFFHVNPSGELEPCPFAPYSTDSLKDVPLAEALQSRFLKTIRDNHDSLSEDQGGCALWNNRQWVEEIVSTGSIPIKIKSDN